MHDIFCGVDTKLALIQTFRTCKFKASTVQQALWLFENFTGSVAEYTMNNCLQPTVVVVRIH